MLRGTYVRFLCSIQKARTSARRFDCLGTSTRKDAHKVASAIEAARKSTAIAAQDGSDDVERTEAVSRVKNALLQYKRLAAIGSPPLALNERGKIEDSEEDSSGGPGENDVTRLFHEEIRAMKSEIIESNKQRVWIGWRGWF
ncbi:hypothetical protein BWQ96_00291 [Gracilariopsis chorda]|uniref:Uncharacterized protein n=1 Tax=Gracilariopsis chorda TaxID=448386 RepID=A0A2V3J6T3_9FLOR|nr:hypothetical protein BWQ96_00291 [Gracilariopsis chorda]|eukprot:PXF50131.1 hypothetical protein BWQ96_00291 [Gracilariopsis chorda]